MKFNKDIAKGIKSGFPIAMGYFPIAIAFGALAIQARLTWFEATLMSTIVYAGASQFISVSLILGGAGAGQIITTTFFVNFRHLIMSMAVNNQIKDFSRAWKTIWCAEALRTPSVGVSYVHQRPDGDWAPNVALNVESSNTSATSGSPVKRSISTDRAIQATVQQVSMARGSYGLPVAASPDEKPPVL